MKNGVFCDVTPYGSYRFLITVKLCNWFGPIGCDTALVNGPVAILSIKVSNEKVLL
jgi:hypothetical protein